MKSFLVVLLLSILFFTFVSAQNDYCCPDHTDIPDIRTNEITQSLQQNPTEDCGDGSYTYVHTATLRDIEDDVEEVGACITTSDTGCSDDNDYTWNNVHSVFNYTSVSLTGVERGNDRTLYVRAKNCAGYNTRSMDVDDYSEPKVVNIDAGNFMCNDQDNTISATFMVTTSEVMVGSLEICVGEDCDDGTYSSISHMWSRTVDVTPNEDITVKATATNCIGNDEMEKTMSLSRSIPNVGPVVNVVPIPADCAGYEVQAYVTNIPSDTSVEACYDGDCKDITGIGSGNSVSWSDNKISFDSNTPDATVSFNVSNCGGDDQTKVTQTVDRNISPTGYTIDAPRNSCPGDEQAIQPIAKVPSLVRQLDSTIEFCMTINGEEQCDTVDPADPFPGTQNYTVTLSGAQVTDSVNTVQGSVNVTTECLGTQTASVAVNVNPKPAPMKNDVSPDIQESTMYCTDDDNTKSFTVEFGNWGYAYNYTLSYRIGQEGDFIDVATEDSGLSKQEATIPDVSKGSTVTYRISAINCMGTATSDDFSFTYEQYPELSLTTDEVSAADTATSKSAECTSGNRNVKVTIPNKGIGVNHAYCVTDEGQSSDDCPSWTTFTDLNQETNQYEDTTAVAKDSSHEIHFRIRYSACSSDFPFSTIASISFTPAEVIKTIGEISAVETSSCDGGDCLPGKKFTVVNDFNEFFLNPPYSVNTLALSVQYCFKQDSSCEPDTPLSFNPGTQLWHTTIEADSTNKTDYTFRAVALYCDSQPDGTQPSDKKESIAAHDATDASNFGVSMTLNEDSCEAEISFTQFDNFDSRVDTYRYCIGDDNGCLADRWYSTEEEASAAVQVSGLPVSTFRVHAYPARCSGYFMDRMASSDTASLPSQPQFESDAEIDGKFNQADGDDCNTYDISVSWPSLDNADKYKIVATVNGQSIFSTEVTEASFEATQDISNFAGADITFSVTAMKNCAGGDRSTITTTQTVPEPDCDGSGTGTGGNGAATASVSVLALVFGLLAVLF